MKRLPRVAVPFVCVLLAVVAGGATAAELRIGFVNTAVLLQKSPQAKAASKALVSEFAPRQKKLMAAQAGIAKLQDKLKRNGEVMSAARRDKLQHEILTRQRELKRKEQEFGEDLNVRRNAELGKLERRIRRAILQVAKDDHYDLIVSDGVLYASKRVDITDKVLRRLEEQAKAPAKK